MATDVINPGTKDEHRQRFATTAALNSSVIMRWEQQYCGKWTSKVTSQNPVNRIGTPPVRRGEAASAATTMPPTTDIASLGLHVRMAHGLNLKLAAGYGPGLPVPGACQAPTEPAPLVARQDAPQPGERRGEMCGRGGTGAKCDRGEGGHWCTLSRSRTGEVAAVSGGFEVQTLQPLNFSSKFETSCLAAKNDQTQVEQQESLSRPGLQLLGLDEQDCDFKLQKLGSKSALVLLNSASVLSKLRPKSISLVEASRVPAPRVWRGVSATLSDDLEGPTNSPSQQPANADSAASCEIHTTVIGNPATRKQQPFLWHAETSQSLPGSPGYSSREEVACGLTQALHGHDSDTGMPVVHQSPPLSLQSSGDGDKTELSAAETLEEDLPFADDLLAMIFLALPPADLSHAAQVSRRWRAMARSPELHAECFRRKWGFARVTGTPSRFAFWALKAPPFVLSHKLRPRDSITSVAVQYGCQTIALRRANNMMSDHAIHTRTRILIPLSNDVLQLLQHRPRPAAAPGGGADELRQSSAAPGTPPGPLAGTAEPSERGQEVSAEQRSPTGVHEQDGPGRRLGTPLVHCSTGEEAGGRAAASALLPLGGWLQGKFCCVEFDAFAKRDVAVVYLSAAEVPAETRGDAAVSDEKIPRNAAKRAEAQARVVRMLMRAFAVDEATAAYYLEEAGGDVRAASQELKSDLQWERSNRQARQR